MPIPHQARGNDEMDLIPADKSASAKAAAIISGSAKTAAAVSTSDKTASPEINRDCCFRILAAQITQQGVDALVVALKRCAWPMQLEDAR
jgi:hypothetical protein